MSPPKLEVPPFTRVAVGEKYLPMIYAVWLLDVISVINIVLYYPINIPCWHKIQVWSSLSLSDMLLQKASFHLIQLLSVQTSCLFFNNCSFLWESSVGISQLFTPVTLQSIFHVFYLITFHNIIYIYMYYYYC
jgi:hypothetical protein